MPAGCSPGAFVRGCARRAMRRLLESQSLGITRIARHAPLHFAKVAEPDEAVRPTQQKRAAREPPSTSANDPYSIFTLDTLMESFPIVPVTAT